MTPEPARAAVRRSLREIFGIRRLRDGQQEVIARVLAGRDTLAIMPTGAGKSLCYQLPALHLDGVTLVVSPLISLMKDQAAKLEAAGVDAEQLNSAIAQRLQDESMARIAEAGADIVLATPERLSEPQFLDTLQRRKVALLVVDEAHCISRWGHDFRPAFLQIGMALERLGQPPVLALTATAPPQVVQDIAEQLGRPRLHVVNTGIYRANLRWQVARCVNEAEKVERLRQALAKATGAGIVYTATVKATDELHARLLADGESVTRYHGRLPAAERRDNQERFMRGDARVMVATNAFGMGIDRADLRFVLHWQMPGSLEAYYQEAGRAGRDGETADCALLFWHRDKQVQQFFLARRYPSADDLQQLFAALRRSAGGSSLAALAQALPGIARNRLAVTLTLLRDSGLARSDRRRGWHAAPGDGPQNGTWATLARDYEDKALRDREALERMVFYAQTGFCRWRVLLDYFDEAAPFDRQRCGRCDNCLRPAAAPAQPVASTASARLPASSGAACRPGDEVQVPRHGRGRVVSVAGDEIGIVFPDSRRRSFVAAYVEPVRNAPGIRFATKKAVRSLVMPAPSQSPSASEDRIDLASQSSVDEWSKKLDVSEEQLHEAVGAVGNRASDVELHLKGTRSTTNAERLDDAGAARPAAPPAAP